MKSFTQLQNFFTTLSQNSSASNSTLAGTLINDAHRYLILKFFDNEGRVSIPTVGAQTLAVTGTIAKSATSATLSTSWPSLSCQQLVTFDNGNERNVTFIQGSTAITWPVGLTAATTTTNIAAVGVQAYPLPANVSKVKNDTITIGQLVYTPAPVQSIQEWTKLNALPYTSDIPAYFYIYNKALYLWPIPSSSGNVMDIYCQISVSDMTYADYSTGTLAASGMVVGSNAVIGTTTAWATPYPTAIDLTFANLFITATPPGGDGLPYQIQSFTDDTHLTLLKQVVNAPKISGANYTIGQYPLLDANFHDMIVYYALTIYFSSIRKDTELYQQYMGIYQERYQMMQFYLSTKQVNVDLSVTPVQQNPNLYIYPSSSGN